MARGIAPMMVVITAEALAVAFPAQALPSFGRRAPFGLGGPSLRATSNEANPSPISSIRAWSSSITQPGPRRSSPSAVLSGLAMDANFPASASRSSSTRNSSV